MSNNAPAAWALAAAKQLNVNGLPDEHVAAVIWHHFNQATPEPKEPTTLQERLNLLRAAIQQGATQRIGTMYFCPSDGSPERVIDDGYAYALIAEQYGSGHEFMTSFPHCDRGTLSVKGGIIRWNEARIAGKSTQ